MKNFLKAGTIALLAGILTGVIGLGTAGAQTQQRVDAKKDWSIFQAGDGGQKICWIVSQPTKTSAIRNGKSVQVNRGDIFLMVSIRPAERTSPASAIATSQNPRWTSNPISLI